MSHLAANHRTVHDAINACEKWKSDVARGQPHPTRHARATDEEQGPNEEEARCALIRFIRLEKIFLWNTVTIGGHETYKYATFLNE